MKLFVRILLVVVGALVLLTVLGNALKGCQDAEERRYDAQAQKDRADSLQHDSLDLPGVIKQRDSLILCATQALTKRQPNIATGFIDAAAAIIDASLHTDTYLHTAKSKVDDVRKLVDEYSSHTELMNLSDEDFTSLCRGKYNANLVSDSGINRMIIQAMRSFRGYRISEMQKKQQETSQQDANRVLVDLQAPMQIGKYYMNYGTLAGSSQVCVFLSPCAGLSGQQRMFLERIDHPDMTCGSVYDVTSVVFPNAAYYNACVRYDGTYCNCQ